MSMETKTMKLLGCVLLAVASVALPGDAQNPKLQINHLDKLESKAAAVVDVTLDGPMLQLAAKFMKYDEDPEDAEVKDLISHLKGIYVKSFEFDHEGEYSKSDVDAVRTQLRLPVWSRIVGVRSKHEGDNAEVYLMGAPDNVQGLAIIAADPKELTIVNIVGPFDIDKLSDLEGHAGIPHLGLESTDKIRKEARRHDQPK